MGKDNLFNYTKFTLVGNAIFGRDNVVTTAKLSPTSKWDRTRLNFGVKNGSSTQFVTSEFIHSEAVKTAKFYGTDAQMFEINLNDTLLQGNIDKVADFVKIKVDLETDFEKKKEIMKLVFKIRNHEDKEEQTPDDIEKVTEYKKQLAELQTNRVEFIHMKDFIKYINDNQEIIKDKKIKVTGNAKCNYYNGKNTLQYIPSLVEFVSEDTENGLQVVADIFYEKDSIEDDKKSNRMFVNGYVGERVKKEEKLFPISVVLDYTKINQEDAQHLALLGFMKDTFKISSKKNFHKIQVELMIVNGAEVKEFDESCLTEKQKMAIMFGQNTLNDFKPKGNTYGDRVTELRVVKPILKGDFQNGAIETFAIDELSYYLTSDDSDVKIDTKKKEETKVEEPKAEEENTDNLLKSLFGQ